MPPENESQGGQKKDTHILPPIGTEIIGGSKPLTKVPGAKWVGKRRDDPDKPQSYTSWVLVAIKNPEDVINSPPPSFEESDYKYSKKKPEEYIDRGNYNADLVAKKYENLEEEE